MIYLETMGTFKDRLTVKYAPEINGQEVLNHL